MLDGRSSLVNNSALAMMTQILTADHIGEQDVPLTLDCFPRLTSLERGLV